MRHEEMQSELNAICSPSGEGLSLRGEPPENEYAGDKVIFHAPDFGVSCGSLSYSRVG